MAVAPALARALQERQRREGRRQLSDRYKKLRSGEEEEDAQGERANEKVLDMEAIKAKNKGKVLKIGKSDSESS